MQCSTVIQLQDSSNGASAGVLGDHQSKGCDGGAAMEIRNRVIELSRMRAKDLLPNPKNWRRHPKAQANALRAMLGEIGNSDAMLARELLDGRLQLLDGHLQAGRRLLNDSI